MNVATATPELSQQLPGWDYRWVQFKPCISDLHCCSGLCYISFLERDSASWSNTILILWLCNYWMYILLWSNTILILWLCNYWMYILLWSNTIPIVWLCNYWLYILLWLLMFVLLSSLSRSSLTAWSQKSAEPTRPGFNSRTLKAQSICNSVRLH